MRLPQWTVLRGVLLALTGALPAGMDSVDAQEPWPTTEFEVASAERLMELGVLREFPEVGEAWIDFLNESFASVDDWLAAAGLDPLGARVYDPAEATRREIEAYLRDAAQLLEEWGLPAPALRQSRGRYQVALLAETPASLIGDEAAGLYVPEICGFLGGLLFLRAGSVLDGDDLTPDGMETLGHELFHAVQGSMAVGATCPFPTGAWITEGSADAVGSDLLRTLRGLEVSSTTEAWGLRDYSRRLPVPKVHPLQGEGTDISAYYTSSLWRYLAERYALGGAMPGPEPPEAVDYGYLARLLRIDPGERDCVGLSAPCASELRWLDLGIRAVFGTNLRYEYPRFVDAISRYGEFRLPAAPDDPVAPQMNGDRIRDQVFGGCDNVYLTTDFPRRISREVVDVLDPVSAECWNVFVEGFPDGVRVGMTVDGPAARAMSDLSASVGGRPTWADTAVVVGDATTDRSSVTWSYTVPDTTTTPFLLSNVGADPGAAARMRNLPVTFTILESTGALVGTEPGGPSPAEIDAPVGLKLDDFSLAEVMPYTAPFEGADFDRPCILRFRMRNQETRDEVTLQMDHEGPIGPGVYPVAPRQDGADDLDRPERWPNQFVVDFGIGPGSALSDGRPQGFRAEAGTVEIESVSGGVVRGRVNAAGWRRRTYAIGEEPWGLSNLTIRADFMVVVRDRVRRARLGRDATGSDCLEPPESAATVEPFPGGGNSDEAGDAEGTESTEDPGNDQTAEEGDEGNEETGEGEPTSTSIDFRGEPGSEVVGGPGSASRAPGEGPRGWTATEFPIQLGLSPAILRTCRVPDDTPPPILGFLREGTPARGELGLNVSPAGLRMDFDFGSGRLEIRTTGPDAVRSEDVGRSDTLRRTRYVIDAAQLRLVWSGGTISCDSLVGFAFEVNETYRTP